MTRWTINSGPHKGKQIDLLTPEEFKWLVNGTVLIDIFGESHVKGRDEIDDDTRFGHLAYGLEVAS